LSPILVRPVREQLEHDRIIRLLHGKFRRKYEAGMNPGVEQNMPVGAGPTALYPDLVLLSQDRGHKLQVIVEIETGESVNHLEALAQWAHFGRVRAAFHLYVPASMVDVARRLTEDNQIHVAEIWSYHVVGDEPRFTLVHRSKEALPAQPRVKAAPKPAPAPKPVAPKAAPKVAPKAKAAAKPKPKPKSKPKAAPKPKAKSAKKKK
jgi:cell division septation protein DedD